MNMNILMGDIIIFMGSFVPVANYQGNRIFLARNSVSTNQMTGIFACLI